MLTSKLSLGGRKKVKDEEKIPKKILFIHDAENGVKNDAVIGNILKEIDASENQEYNPVYGCVKKRVYSKENISTIQTKIREIRKQLEDELYRTSKTRAAQKERERVETKRAREKNESKKPKEFNMDDYKRENNIRSDMCLDINTIDVNVPITYQSDINTLYKRLFLCQRSVCTQLEDNKVTLQLYYGCCVSCKKLYCNKCSAGNTKEKDGDGLGGLCLGCALHMFDG